MSLGRTVMIFGLGDLGGWVLEFLARQHGINRIVTCDPREDYGELKSASVQVGAGHMGFPVTIKFEKCDVFDIDRTTELITRYNPDFIYAAMTQMSWWVPALLPREVHDEIEKAAGPLMPTHVTLVSKLMKAMKKAGIKVPVLNHSWPDLTNPILARNGLGPTIGAGNADLIVADIKMKVSLAKNIPIPQIQVFFVGEHVLDRRNVKLLGIPYFCKIMIDGKDITKEFDVGEMINGVFVRKPPRSVQISWLVQNVAATSAVRTIMGIMNDTGELTHAPGPNGLIGGYPVRLRASGVEVVLPEELTLEEAQKINMEDCRFEGVEEMKADGTLVFTDEAHKVMREYFSMTQTELRFEEMEERSKEIIAAYKRLAAKYNVPTYFY